jgi:glutathione peroxidase-family protein
VKKIPKTSVAMTLECYFPLNCQTVNMMLISYQRFIFIHMLYDMDSEVNGDNEAPVYKWLKESQPGILG